MPKYILKDGTRVEAPGDLTPEEQAWLDSEGAKRETPVWKDVLKSAGSGLAEGAIRAPFIGGDLFALGAQLLEKIRPGSTTEQNRASMSDQVLQGLSDLPGNIANEQGKPFSSADPLTLYNPETQAGRYANSAGNAVGGLVLGGTSAFKAPLRLAATKGPLDVARKVIPRLAAQPVVQAAGIGAAGEFAGDVSRGFDETQAQNPLARMGGATTAALAAALMGRVKTPRAERPLYEAVKGMGPEDWAAAQAENARLGRAGASTRTVGDSLPATNQLSALEREVSNTTGGQALYNKLAGRQTGEIPRLLAEAKGAAQRTAVPQLGGSFSPLDPRQSIDDAVFSLARGNRTAEMLPHLKGAPLMPEEDLAPIVRALQQRAMAPGNAGTVDAQSLGNAASTLNGLPRYPLPQPPGPGPVRGPGVVTGGPAAPMPAGVPPTPQLGAPLPALPAPQAPPGNALVPGAPAGPLATSGIPPIPAGDARNMLPPKGGFQMPQPAQPITDIEFPTPQGVNLEALSKEVKRLMTVGDAPPAQGAPAGTVLNRAASRGAAGEASALLRKANPHYDAAMEAYAGASPRVDIARILAENKLKPIQNPSTSSLPVDDVREQLSRALRKVDPSMETFVNEKLRAADTLSRNTAEHGVEGLAQQLGQSPLAAALTPFGSGARYANTASRIKSNKLIADLLADPSPANYEILRKLSQTDPAVARALREQGLLGATNATGQTEGSFP